MEKSKISRKKRVAFHAFRTGRNEWKEIWQKAKQELEKGKSVHGEGERSANAARGLKRWAGRVFSFHVLLFFLLFFCLFVGPFLRNLISSLFRACAGTRRAFSPVYDVIKMQAFNFAEAFFSLVDCAQFSSTFGSNVLREKLYVKFSGLQNLLHHVRVLNLITKLVIGSFYDSM